LDEIVEDALRVLAEIGVACTHPGTRERLEAWGGVTFGGDWVLFAPDRVREHLAAARALPPAEAIEDVRFTLGGCWAGLQYCDPETGQVRPATSEDAAQMARLWDARGLSGVVPLMPGDVPPALATVEAERIALLNSRSLGGYLTVLDPPEVELLIDMNQVVGRRYRLMEQVGISPLRLDEGGLDTALRYLDDPRVEVHLAGFIPMAGVTCPLDPRSAAVQSIAETLAMDCLRAALGLGGGDLGIRIEPFDMQYSGIVFGSPEWCLYGALAMYVSAYLSGRPQRGGRFRSVAKAPDPQAACERTASALWQALLGARHFGAVGQLSVDEVFSPQQAVIDREILGYVERVVRGLELGRETGALALIRQGVAAGHFMGAEDTLDRYRDFYRFPNLFRHWGLQRWRAEGAPSILEQAWARAQAEIASSNWRLEEGQAREVECIAGRARVYLGG
jgi:trimethylamine--corrinoid protein Co-methyltransferase